MMIDNQLASELQRLEIAFLRGDAGSSSVDPVELIAGLAASEEARLRLALIPLLVQRPDYSAHVNKALRLLDAAARLTLVCYYTAAVLLQRKYAEQLESMDSPFVPLPDYFAEELGLSTIGNPSKTLEMLADRQSTLSGERINWLGTYEHAFNRWWAQRKREATWQR
jgi:hypothetical protein